MEEEKAGLKFLGWMLFSTSSLDRSLSFTSPSLDPKRCASLSCIKYSFLTDSDVNVALKLSLFHC